MNSQSLNADSCEPSKGMNVGRQTHLIAGTMVWSGILLSLVVNPWWLALCALPGFGLLLDALTGICPMTLILKKMPWNASAKVS